ncbi:MAG: amino acid ABC transporter permease [Candidatus Liberibacter ctenarytainae]|uniref:Amino acid ABC transporter permease n=1 Tax=Candidatus Liberibacter ctenarytainae TaxID=2020335 RepID=A0A937AQW6_9HYPH|nr:amino acid ABC transporter permease [Candidatus Liberibacter ctenarytainae]
MAPEWFDIAVSSFPKLLYATFVLTIPIALISFFSSMVVGLLIALIRVFLKKKIVFILHIYVWIFRGTPLLILLFMIFYGLASIGIVFNAFSAVLIGMTLCFSAYISEIIRTSIISIPKGQWEAAHTIGLTWIQTMRHVILPQAFMRSIAPLSSEFISVFKSTSLAASVTVPEVFQTGQRIISITYQPFVIYLEICLIYLTLTSLCYVLQVRMEIFCTRYTNSQK